MLLMIHFLDDLVYQQPRIPGSIVQTYQAMQGLHPQQYAEPLKMLMKGSEQSPSCSPYKESDLHPEYGPVVSVLLTVAQMEKLGKGWPMYT